MSGSFHIVDRDLTASPFCMGTIGWGTQLRGDDLDRLYDAFRSAGGNFFDSAHVYSFWLPNGLGASERALGEIVRRRGDRDRVILATKGGHPDAGSGYARPDRYIAPAIIAQDISESLDRLGVDCIDLYYLHRDDPRVPVGEIIDLLNRHIDSGQLRAIGASNWTTARIDAGNEYAAANNKRGFVISQPKFSLGVPKPSKDPTVPMLDSRNGMARINMRPGVRLLADSQRIFRHQRRGAGGWATPSSIARLREANRIAIELGVTPNQVALAWLLHQSFLVIPILGTVSVAHLNDALAADKVRLSPQQVRSLTDAGC